MGFAHKLEYLTEVLYYLATTFKKGCRNYRYKYPSIGMLDWCCWKSRSATLDESEIGDFIRSCLWKGFRAVDTLFNELPSVWLKKPRFVFCGLVAAIHYENDDGDWIMILRYSCGN